MSQCSTGLGKRKRGGSEPVVVGGAPEDVQPILVSERQAAMLLGIDRTVIRRAIAEGQLIRRRVGAGYRAKFLLMYRDLMLFADTLPLASPTEGDDDEYQAQRTTRQPCRERSR